MRYLFLLCIFYMLCIYNVVPVLFVFELFCKCQGREANVFMYSVLSEKAYYAINGFSCQRVRFTLLSTIASNCFLRKET